MTGALPALILLAVLSTEGPTEEQPERKSTITESVEVVGKAEPEDNTAGTASTMLDPTETTGLAPALADVTEKAPGVSENGQGGLFQVVSIRGISRQRVANLVGPMRIRGERRAGVSLSFIDPTLLGQIEVLRGPSTVYNGPGALGGAIRVSPRFFGGPWWSTGYSTGGDENVQAGGFGDDSWSFGISRRQAQDQRSAEGDPLHSGFEQWSASLQWRARRGGTSYRAFFVPSQADDIGKANNTFPDTRTDYPRERHALAGLTAEADSGWSFALYAHAQDLETFVTDAESESLVTNESLDFGSRVERSFDGPGPFGYKIGLETFSRRGVDASESFVDKSGGTAADPVVSSPLDGGRGDELGLYGSLHFQNEKVEIEAGVRGSLLEQENGGEGGDDDRSVEALSEFVGFGYAITDGLRVRGNFSTGVRLPSLSELFFSGTTGRGDAIVGNPDLEEERSTSAELGLQWVAPGIVVQANVFRTRISDYIERIRIGTDLRSFVNRTSGTIQGVELESRLFLPKGTTLSLGGHLLRGRDSAGIALDDTPPHELQFGAARSGKRWGFRGDLSWRATKGDPGPGEVPLEAALLVDAELRYSGFESFTLALAGENLTDESYFPSADDRAPRAPERAVSFQLRWEPK